MLKKWEDNGMGEIDFTVPYVSQSQPSAHILIQAAKRISAFNVTLVWFIIATLTVYLINVFH